jgi:hypothetical protein
MKKYFGSVLLIFVTFFSVFAKADLECQTGSPRDKRVVKIEGKFPGFIRLYEMDTMTGLADQRNMRIFDSNFPETKSGYLRFSGQKRIGTFDWENILVSVNTNTKQGALTVSYNDPKRKSWSLNFTCTSLSY